MIDKTEIVAKNYFKTDCPTIEENVNCLVKDAYIKGFQRGVEKARVQNGQSAYPTRADQFRSKTDEELLTDETKDTVWNRAEDPPKKAGEYLVTGKWRDEPREYWVCTFSSIGPISGWVNSASNPPIQAWAQITPFEA